MEKTRTYIEKKNKTKSAHSKESAPQRGEGGSGALEDILRKENLEELLRLMLPSRKWRKGKLTSNRFWILKRGYAGGHPRVCSKASGENERYGRKPIIL